MTILKLSICLVVTPATYVVDKLYFSRLTFAGTWRRLLFPTKQHELVPPSPSEIRLQISELLVDLLLNLFIQRGTAISD